MLDILNHLAKPSLKHWSGFKMPQTDCFGTVFARPRERSVGMFMSNLYSQLYPDNLISRPSGHVAPTSAQAYKSREETDADVSMAKS